MTEDITFCANKKCRNKSCKRNMKNAKSINRPHSFSLFTQCPNWSDEGGKWLADQIDEEEQI